MTPVGNRRKSVDKDTSEDNLMPPGGMAELVEGAGLENQ